VVGIRAIVTLKSIIFLVNIQRVIFRR